MLVPEPSPHYSASASVLASRTVNFIEPQTWTAGVHLPVNLIVLTRASSHLVHACPMSASNSKASAKQTSRNVGSC